MGLLYLFYVSNGTTICALLVNHLKPAIRSNRHGLLTTPVKLLHDNARPLTAHVTVTSIKELCLECLLQPLYSADLAPSDFHVFGALQQGQSGRKFRSDEEVPEAVHDQLCKQPKYSFQEGFML